MYRATTPKHIFVFDLNPELAFTTILITYAQDDRIVLEKSGADFISVVPEVTDNGTVYKATIQLTQEEANKFNNRSRVKVQVRVVDTDGNVSASKMMTIPVNDVLNDEVLG